MGDIDNAVVSLRFVNGAIGNIDLSRNARYGYDVRTEVLGSTGAVIIGGRTEPAGVSGVQLLGPAAADNDPTPFFVRRFAAAYRAQIEHFLDCLEHQRQPSVGGHDALAAFEIAHAASLSAQTGRSVSLAELRTSATG